MYVIVVEHENCVGCRTCEAVCSLSHEGEIGPLRSRIGVVKWEALGLAVPMNCRQCDDAPCAAVCPVKAISRDENLNRVMVEYSKCIGCRTCVTVCPFGGMSFDLMDGRVIKCDLCDGDPLCVRFCAYGALRYIDAVEMNSRNRRRAALRLAQSAQRSMKESCSSSIMDITM